MHRPRWAPPEASTFWGTVAAPLARPLLGLPPRPCADALLGLGLVCGASRDRGGPGEALAAHPGASSRSTWALGLGCGSAHNVGGWCVSPRTSGLLPVGLALEACSLEALN